MKSTFYHGSISLNALREKALIPATASTTVQSASSAPREDLHCKNRSFLDWSAMSLDFRILSAHQSAMIFLVRVAYLLICNYCGKYIQVFPRWALQPRYQLLLLQKILLGSSLSNIQKRCVSVQLTSSSAKQSAQLLCYQATSDSWSLLFCNVMTLLAYPSLIKNCGERYSMRTIWFCDCHKGYNGRHNDNNSHNSHGSIKKLLATQDLRGWRNCVSKHNSRRTYVSKFEDLMGQHIS